MVAPVHNLDATILLEGSAKLRWGGGVGGEQGTEFNRFYLFLGSSEAAMDGGVGAQRPFGVAMRSKRRVRAAHGRAREAKTH
jgi:hypothetical protein